MNASIYIILLDAQPLPIPARAGSVLLFDMRISHRGLVCNRLLTLCRHHDRVTFELLPNLCLVGPRYIQANGSEKARALLYIAFFKEWQEFARSETITSFDPLSSFVLFHGNRYFDRVNFKEQHTPLYDRLNSRRQKLLRRMDAIEWVYSYSTQI